MTTNGAWRALAAKGSTVVGIGLPPFDPTPRYVVRFAPAVARAGHGAHVGGRTPSRHSTG